MATMDNLQRIMDRKHCIRILTLIAHVNHGLSTLADVLVSAPGIKTQNVGIQLTDTCADEGESSIRIKSSGISLSYEDDRSGNNFVISLIDLPRYADLFYSEITTALRTTDGALVIVDCVEGVCVQTETVLRQALSERVRPLLTINKMDRCFLELNADGESAYQMFRCIIESTNAIITQYEDLLFTDVEVSPEKGTVAFSSGLYGWAFTLKHFAEMYVSKFHVEEAKMIDRLWGENYFDPITRKWTKTNTGSSTCKRGFVHFVYEPLRQIISICMSGQKEKLWQMLQKLSVTLQSEEKDLIGKALMMRVMQTWLPAGSAMLEMIVVHLPSPSTAQKYRVENLYDGPLDDKFAIAIRNCDSDGPLMLYVSKMISVPDEGRFFAFGRIFSGKVSTGSMVRILGPNYVLSQREDFDIQCVHRIMVSMDNEYTSVEVVPCGHLVTIFGLDLFRQKTATLTDEEEFDAHPIKAVKFSVFPVLHVVVQCKLASDSTKLTRGLVFLAKSDPMVVCSIKDSGRHIIAGAGELHLKVCLKILADDFMGGAEIVTSEPFVYFRETVTEKSTRTVVSQSPNQNNELYMEAQPLDDGLAQAMIEGRIGPKDDPDIRADILYNEFGWDKKLAKKIWSFGSETAGPNLIVNMSDGACSINELKNSVSVDFQRASEEGALAKEHMHGIRFDICNAFLHADWKYKRNNQVTPMIRQALVASQLTAKPRLLEPVYLVVIEAPQAKLEQIYVLFEQKNGCIFEEIPRPDTVVYTVKGYLPVRDSFGFTNALRVATSGQTFLNYIVFDHWSLISSDPLELGSSAAQLVSNIRMYKGLKQLSEFNVLQDL